MLVDQRCNDEDQIRRCLGRRIDAKCVLGPHSASFSAELTGFAEVWL